MAEYHQKLKVRLKGGMVQEVRVYSTKEDIPVWQKPMKVRIVNGLPGWVPTSPLGSPDASNLRVRHPGSKDIYVVNTIGRAVYGKHFIGTAGDFEFTVPAGARKLRITLVGGGSTGIYEASVPTGVFFPTTEYRSNAGSATLFCGYIAGGAASAPISCTRYLSEKIPPENGYFQEYGSPATVTHSYYSYTANDDGYSYTVSRNDYFNPGTGYGAGSAGFSTEERTHWRGGLRGKFTMAEIAVVPGTILRGTVGAGGKGFTLTGWDCSTMGNAAQGCVFIEWGGEIE